jgi:D-serine deaminase-like pyridoxal phosphate-dependent protein
MEWIEKPSLILDENRVRENIARMAEKARTGNVQFRPHFKTHQSRTVGRWFREFGVQAITVSSVDMAQYFANDGWQDITIAFPVNLRQMKQINQLAERIRLHLLVDHPDAVEHLGKMLAHSVRVWLKVDVGYRRAGVLWEDRVQLARLVQSILRQEKMHFAGLLSHFGHTYQASGPEQIRKIYRKAVERMRVAADVCRKAGAEEVRISIGDTPSCSIVDDFLEVDEIRPGNFVFYDWEQQRLGSCTDQHIAMAVACPVVGVYPGRSGAVIYGGAVHFGKQFALLEDGTKAYGVAASEGWRITPEMGLLVSVSQEHGIVRLGKEWKDRIRIGDVLTFFPVHSCLTANNFACYHTTRGQIIGKFRSLFSEI